MIDYTKSELALRHLRSQYENHCTIGHEQPALIQEAVAESVIQRFERCYDCMWKVLKRHLTEALGLPDVPASPKPGLRLANENSLLPSEVEPWIDYANARTATAHNYSGEKAKIALGLMDDFVDDASQLHTKLSGTSSA